MSKEPIELGHSVERHKHHSTTDHSHGSAINEEEPPQRTDRQFGVESLNRVEEFLAVVFVGMMIIGILALIIFIVFG